MKDRLQNQGLVLALATLCCLLWGSAYPAVKIGYVLFDIDTTGAQVLFAGYRFSLAGIITWLITSLYYQKIVVPRGDEWGRMVSLGLVQTTLQYIFFYIGLAYTTGVNGSIMNATGTFFSVLLAHFIYHNDKLSYNKTLGCILGFAGVMLVNFHSGLSEFHFVWNGDGFVVLAAFILSAATLYGKRISQTVDPMVMTGWQLAIGGAMLVAGGYVTGGTLVLHSVNALAVLGYLTLLSSVAFALWSMLLKVNRVSMIAPFNFVIPVAGTVLSAIFLGENILEIKYAVALVLVCSGIWWVNKVSKK